MGLTPEQDRAYRALQKRKNRWVGLALLSFIVLVFVITVLKQGAL